MFTGGTVINVTGTAADNTDFKSYTLDYGVGENPASWSVLKSATTTPVTNGLLYAWDTSALTGGVYTLRLTVTDNSGNVAVETSRVRLLWIQNAAASEAYISPNGDAVKDATTVSASFTQQSNWTIDIKNSSGSTVRTYAGTAVSVTQSWDGKDEAGQVVSDGAYTYQISAVSSETNIAAAPRTGTITVDTTSPTALITAPGSNAVLWNTVQIMGTASDTNLDNYRLEYGPASGSGPWTTIATGTTPVTSGTLATWVTNDGTNAVLIQNGGYMLRLAAYDKAGNSATTTVPVSTDNLILSNIGISSNTIDTLASQSSSIFFTINAPATATLKIIPEKQGPAGAPVYQTTQTVAAGGAYSFTWDGKDSAGKVVPDEAYLYVLEASDGTKTDSYSPPQPAGTGSVTCTQETAFDPYKNDPLTITYTLPQAARVDISISWGSQNFKIMSAGPAASGTHTFDWDGRNPNGTVLDDGAAASCAVASLIRENHIITMGDTVKITSIKTDPYRMGLSYGQFTRIAYTLPHDAVVTVKLIAPSGASVTLVDNEPQTAGAHEYEWRGLDSADAAGKKLVISEEGDYTVWVQTVNPATGTSSVTKGFLGVGY